MTKIVSRYGLFRSLGFVFLAALFQPLQATTVSLPELLKKALENKSLQNQLSASAHLAQLKRRQVEMERWLSTLEMKALTGIVPDVEVNKTDANQFLFNPRSGDPEDDFSLANLGPFLQIEVNAVQPIYTFGKISSYQKMADRNVAMTEAEKRKEIDQARFLVKKAYYTLQFSTEGLKILEEVRSKLKEAEEKVEKRLIKNAENVEENDRLKIKAFQTDVESRALDATRGNILSRAALAELAGVTGDWVPDQATIEPEVVKNLEKDDILKKTFEARPEINQLDEVIKIKTAEKGTIQADLYPTIFLAGKLEYAVAPGRDDVKNPYLKDDFNKFGMGGALGLKQDLGVHRTLNKMEMLEAEIQKYRAQRERLLSLSRIRTEEAFEKAVASFRGIQINEDGLRAARSWLTSAGLAFNLGTATTKDILESYAAYFKARVDLLNSIYDLNNALADLSAASGYEVVDRLR